MIYGTVKEQNMVNAKDYTQPHSRINRVSITRREQHSPVNPERFS